MRIILAGGGGARDSLPIDQLLAGWLGPGGKVLYWPIALRGLRTFDSCFEWITSTFRPLGITDIGMWTELAGHTEHELAGFDGLYIGGGNTFSLLAELRESGFDRYVRRFVTSGRPVYGGSAGAVLLGRDIGIVEGVDRNLAGLTDTAGLDLAGGHAVWPHYEPQHDSLIQSYVERVRFPVLAIPERSGVVIEGSKFHGAGYQPVFRFDERGKAEV